ncbi:MAG: DUF4157 domain-containing protein, partial [Actinomycetota bacterium]|nr:DUF4157 domain-containing protein [Actinomycetota bacterium]
LRERLGNQGAGAFIARSVVPEHTPAPSHPSIAVAAPVAPQLSTAQRLAAKVSKPTDPAELEAEETARKVVRMGDHALPAQASTPKESARGETQRAAIAPASAPVAAPHPSTAHAGGAPLPSSVRRHMEPRFGANFGSVRVHTGESAAQHSAALGANAFTIGQDIYFGRDRFQPQSAAGQELIAHELTHTIQQGAVASHDVVHRSVPVGVAERVEPHIQRSFLGIKSPREYFADKAQAIPGFTMLTLVIGYNPITNARVDRTAGNILRAAIQLIPGGAVVTEALDKHGVFDAVSLWVAKQFEMLGGIAAGISQDIDNFIKNVGLSDLADLGGLWERAKAIVMRPVTRLIAFASSVKAGIVALVKSAILKPLAAWARTTRTYALIATILGRDPITGEPVPQDAEALVGAFLRFIGEDELWATIQKANAVPRVFAWFKTAKAALDVILSEIPAEFAQAFRALEVSDVIFVSHAFLKVAAVFFRYAGRFLSWGGHAVWNLLEIVFDVVAPGALVWLKKTGAALQSILRNPIPFMTNLVNAGKLGFLMFASNFLEHLKAGLLEWLTGALPSVYIPKSFALLEILKFVLSVLGLTWANIRQKLVKATSEPVVKALETGFELVVTLVRDGPAAAWDLIKEQLANLKSAVIDGITDFVVDLVVKKAIPKLIALFIPGAGFISAILTIYDTIMVFVNKIKQIIQVVKSFLDSIVAIASGEIVPAATSVENALARALSLAISFLAGFLGLGSVADKVLAVIEKIRAPIDKALDWLVNWIVTAIKRLGKFIAGKAEDLLDWWNEKLGFTTEDGDTHTLQFIGSGESAELAIATTPMTVRHYLDTHPDKDSDDRQKVKNWQLANSVFEDAKKVIYTPAKKDEPEKERR